MVEGTLGRGLTVRSRLVDRCGRAPVTVIMCPAGFGKTKLLQSWQTLAAAAAPTAYVSFDVHQRANARDAGLMLADAAADLGAHEPHDLVALIPADGSSLGVDFVRALAETLRALPHPFVLFLDDVHELSPAAARDLGYLISRVGDDSHRVGVATRTEPPWPVQRWRISGFSNLLSASDLQFTEDEVAALLGAQLVDVLPQVMSTTAGWPAALEAVRWRLELDPHAEIDAAVLDLDEYVVAEVFPCLQAFELRLLCRTSILHRFPARVAAVVAEEARAEVILRDMIRRTSLVSNVDDSRFAYHPVLRQALRHHLASLEPGAEPRLHARAADAWLDEPSSVEATAQAIDHLIEAHAWDRARELIRERWADLYEQSRIDLLVHELDRIPEQHWRDDVGIALMYAWLNNHMGRSGRALDVFHSAAVAAHPIGSAVAQLAYANGTWWSTDPFEALDLIDRGLTTLRRVEPGARFPNFPSYTDPDGFLVLGEQSAARAVMLLGRFDDAVRQMGNLLERPSQMAVRTTVTVHGELAWVKAMQGECEAATHHCDQALVLADEGGLSNHILVAPAHLARAVVAISGGDAAAAMVHCEDAARRARPVRAAGLLRCCELVAAMSGHPDHSFTGDLEGPLAPPRLPLVDQFVVAASARRHARLGDHAGAEAQLRTTKPHEMMLSAWTEVLLGVFDRRWVDRWVRSRPQPTCLRAQIARWLAEATTTDHFDEVLALSIRASEAAAPQRLLGTLLDAPVQLWSRDALGRADHPLLIEAMERQRSRADAPAPVSFTERELELVRLMTTSLSAAELADRMFVSVNTLKWHTANIYRKLGAKRRDHAVARATEVGLLDPPQA